MNMFKRLALVATVALMGLSSLELGGNILGDFSVVSPAEARVGRPLTPVSVAGVARRTARRCAAGVYYC
ncbi:hypothetical protein ABSY17_04295 (plasmid) [Mesorhizobium sp. ANAO-SY3R2]